MPGSRSIPGGVGMPGSRSLLGDIPGSGRGWVYQTVDILGVIPEVGGIPGEGWVRIPGGGYDLVHPTPGTDIQ